MSAKVPPGCTRFILSESERFPTLSVDDGTWRGDPMGSEPAGFHEYDRTVILPDTVYTMWEEASARLRVVELMILEIETLQRRFDDVDGGRLSPRPAEPGGL